MLHQRIYKLWAAVAMMLLLLIGILPKPVVHETLTGHAHTAVHPSEQQEVAEAGTLLNCNCNQVVFVSAFDLPATLEISSPTDFYPSYSTPVSDQVLAETLTQPALRGPPVSLI